jgi:hypothetical protein
MPTNKKNSFDYWDRLRTKQATNPRGRTCGSRRAWQEDKGLSDIVAEILYLGEALDAAGHTVDKWLIKGGDKHAAWFDYQTGIGLREGVRGREKPTYPDLDDVLECLVMDYDTDNSIDNLIDELGYDYREARTLSAKLRENKAKLAEWLNAEQREMFRDV